MPGTLKDIRELEAELDAAGHRGVTKQELLDLLKSQAYVGGVLSLKGGESPTNDLTIAGGWNRCDPLFDRSVDTQGVKDGLADATDPGAWFEIRPAGAGDWAFGCCVMQVEVDTAGDYDLRFAHVDDQGVSQTTPYMRTLTAAGAGELMFVIGGGIEKAVEAGERLQPEMRGPNGSVISGRSCQFVVRRG